MHYPIRVAGVKTLCHCMSYLQDLVYVMLEVRLSHWSIQFLIVCVLNVLKDQAYCLRRWITDKAFQFDDVGTTWKILQNFNLSFDFAVPYFHKLSNYLVLALWLRISCFFLCWLLRRHHYISLDPTSSQSQNSRYLCLINVDLTRIPNPYPRIRTTSILFWQLPRHTTSVFRKWSWHTVFPFVKFENQRKLIRVWILTVIWLVSLILVDLSSLTRVTNINNARDVWSSDDHQTEHVQVENRLLQILSIWWNIQKNTNKWPARHFVEG